MGRSLYGMLHRRYGRRPTGAERARHARWFEERLRAALPMGVLHARPAAGTSQPTVAVIGAGFAGCAAAHVLYQNLGWQVTVYDATGTYGGRVSSSTSIVPGRILEAGAELIGLNHPAWILLADIYGFALGVVTPDDDYAGVGLEMPMILQGQQVESGAIYDGMTSIIKQWVSASAQVTNPLTPWTLTNATTLDGMSLGSQVPAPGTSQLSQAVAYAIGVEFELNNTVDIEYQSWLANLAQFQAGQFGPGTDGLNFYDYTEVFRCTAGNQQLALALLEGLPVNQATVAAIDTAAGQVTLTFAAVGNTLPPAPATFDYVLVATSVDAWANIQFNGGSFPYDPVQKGPAIKYLAPVPSRFWIQNLQAPNAMSDTLGMTWEGTDNQADTAGFELTVFAGGTCAQAAIAANGTDAYFQPLISALYPGFSTTGGTFPSDPPVLMGYSCPAPGDVTGAQKSYVTPAAGCLVVAGEHTSPAWFGFMEGALESGIAAALRLAQCASVPLPAEWGGKTAL